MSPSFPIFNLALFLIILLLPKNIPQASSFTIPPFSRTFFTSPHSHQPPSSSQLYSKNHPEKGLSRTRPPPGKVEVLLLQSLQGTGDRNDIVIVSSHFFKQVLQPKKQAVAIYTTEQKAEIVEIVNFQREITAFENEIKDATTGRTLPEYWRTLVKGKEINNVSKMSAAVSTNDIIEAVVASYMANAEAPDEKRVNQHSQNWKVTSLVSTDKRQGLILGAVQLTEIKNVGGHVAKIKISEDVEEIEVKFEVKGYVESERKVVEPVEAKSTMNSN